MVYTDNSRKKKKIVLFALHHNPNPRFQVVTSNCQYCRVFFGGRQSERFGDGIEKMKFKVSLRNSEQLKLPVGFCIVL